MIFVEQINVVNRGSTVLYFWHYILYPIYSGFKETAEKFHMWLIPWHQIILRPQGVDRTEAAIEGTTNMVYR
jgi:hypothetical protein